MTMRLKQVISSTIVGAIDNSVKAKSTWMATSASFGCPTPSMPMFKVKGGSPPTEVPVVVGACATACSGATASNSTTSPKRNPVMTHPV